LPSAGLASYPSATESSKSSYSPGGAMAWLDDRIWCHPKFTSLPAQAAWVYVKGIAYSSGMGTKGVLDAGAQRMLGSTQAIRAVLVDAELWDANGRSSAVTIHDWEDHNAARDERKRRDRERKRAARKGQG
jgi:hypothetical protein